MVADLLVRICAHRYAKSDPYESLSLDLPTAVEALIGANRRELQSSDQSPCSDLCTTEVVPEGVASTANPTLASLLRAYIRNGQCDDGRSGSATSVCDRNTDCSDCGGVQYIICNNHCDVIGYDRFGFASNGICQDGGPGWEQYGCEYGADCNDCGPRDHSPPPPALSCPAAMRDIDVVVSEATRSLYSSSLLSWLEVPDDSVNGHYVQQSCDSLFGTYHYVSESGQTTISLKAAGF